MTSEFHPQLRAYYEDEARAWLARVKRSAASEIDRRRSEAGGQPHGACRHSRDGEQLTPGDEPVPPASERV